MLIKRLHYNIHLYIDHYKKVEILMQKLLWFGFGNQYFKELLL